MHNPNAVIDSDQNDDHAADAQILLVDDKIENLIALEAILESNGVQLITAMSGERALEILANKDISLVLLDVQMPGMDGYEVLRHIRDNPRTRHIPTLIITAYARDDAAILNGYVHGALDYILRPINKTVLCSKVQLILELTETKRQLQISSALLHKQKMYYESMLNAAGEGVLGVDTEGLINFANPTASKLLASQPQELMQRDFSQLMHLSHAPPKPWRQSLFFRYWKSRRALRLPNAQLQRMDGQLIPVSLSCSRIEGENAGSVIMLQDISGRKTLEEQLRRQAVTDPLTGLYNRNGFKQSLQESLRRASRTKRHVALFLIDLDHFKDINDTLGHDCGDKILREVAARLTQAVRSKDTITRLGGDEFSVIVDDLSDIEYAAIIARKMLRSLHPPCALAEQSITLAASIGIALFPDNCNDVEGLILAADLAMYCAKNQGRDTFHFFTPELNIRARARLMLEQGLRRAVEQQEFFLVYQPQIDIATEKVVGIEALIRWNRGGNDTLSPTIFVPLLEQTGLINGVGDWVIRNVAKQRHLWKHVLPDDCPLALNLSPRQFEGQNLLLELTRAIEEYALAPGMLEVELTEGILMQESGLNHGTLSALRKLGVRLSIDDFGTGYSSLSYLMQFDIDALKIDQSFITRLAHSDKDHAITASIINLAHNLQLKVVAEGVETPEQLAVLKNLGCDYVQGYLYARPMTQQNLEKFEPLQR